MQETNSTHGETRDKDDGRSTETATPDTDAAAVRTWLDGHWPPSTTYEVTD